MSCDKAYKGKLRAIEKIQEVGSEQFITTLSN